MTSKIFNSYVIERLNKSERKKSTFSVKVAPEAKNTFKFIYFNNTEISQNLPD